MRHDVTKKKKQVICPVSKSWCVRIGGGAIAPIDVLPLSHQSSVRNDTHHVCGSIYMHAPVCLSRLKAFGSIRSAQSRRGGPLPLDPPPRSL